MVDQDQLSNIKTRLHESRHLVIVLPPRASHDQVAAALGALGALEGADKRVTVVATETSPVISASPSLPGIERLTSSLANKDLQVTFPYRPEQVDKVSYTVDEEAQQFNLVIQPKKGVAPLSSTEVTFSHVGADADMIFLLGVNQLEDLGKTYVENQSLFSDATLISLAPFQSGYPSLYVDTSQVSSYSEGFFQLLNQLEIVVMSDPASLFLSGIESETDRLQSLGTSATTYEVVAQLLRLGARRVHQWLPKQPDHSFEPKPAPTALAPASTGSIFDFTPEIAENTPSSSEVEQPFLGQPASPATDDAFDTQYAIQQLSHQSPHTSQHVPIEVGQHEKRKTKSGKAIRPSLHIPSPASESRGG